MGGKKAKEAKRHDGGDWSGDGGLLPRDRRFIRKQLRAVGLVMPVASAVEPADVPAAKPARPSRRHRRFRKVVRRWRKVQAEASPTWAAIVSASNAVLSLLSLASGEYFAGVVFALMTWVFADTAEHAFAVQDRRKRRRAARRKGKDRSRR